jgi:hypothetical protein
LIINLSRTLEDITINVEKIANPLKRAEGTGMEGINDVSNSKIRDQYRIRPVIPFPLNNMWP